MNNTSENFLKYVALTNDDPLMFQPDHGEGIYLFDDEGKAYIDLIAGVCVNALGHCHPAITAAVSEQMQKYAHTMVYGEHVQLPQVHLAQKLASLLPSTLNNVYFTNSGTEAMEGAMKMAKRATGRHQFVSMQHSYHGSTQGSLSLNSESYFTAAFRPLLPHVTHIRFNAIEDLEVISKETAAVVVESVQGGAGYIPATRQYMRALRNRCDDTGTLLILDEIQAGFGRTGTFWSFEDYNIVPDILLLGKALGGGLPLGAFIADVKLMSNLRRNPALGHITSFGGNPVSCAASLAMLEVLVDEKYYLDYPQKEQRFRLKLDHPKIKNISGKGLMLAVELESFEAVYTLVKAGLNKGFLINWFLFNDLRFRLSPPLNITDAEIDEACELINEALEEL